MSWNRRRGAGGRGMHRLVAWAPWLCAVAAAGCMVGPDFHPPATTMPPRWVGPTTAPTTRMSPDGATGKAELVRWWNGFGDPLLTSLMERAIQSNLDLKQAMARIRAARASRGAAWSGLWPSADAVGSYARSGSGAGVSSGPTGASFTQNLFQAGLDASWELDVFGGVRRSVEAAEADLAAAVEDSRNVRVTLTAEVGLNYIQLRGFQQQILIARQNLQDQEHSADLTRQRMKGGLVSSLDVANADALVATTAASIPPLEISARQTIYSLSVLLGWPPGELVAELSPSEAIPPAPPEMPTALPGELLRRRPDIRRAEAQIHGATARIGVATADLFPKFSFVANGGYQNGQLGRLLRSPNRTWTLGPSVDWKLFDAWKTWFNMEVQEALTEQAALTYEQAVLTALQDVENALVAYAQEQVHRKSLIAAVAANQKAVEVSRQLYMAGQTEFLNVLDAERSLLSTQDALVQSTQNLSTDMVSLYKAMGGGWDELYPPDTGHVWNMELRGARWDDFFPTATKEELHPPDSRQGWNMKSGAQWQEGSFATPPKETGRTMATTEPVK